MVPCKCCGQSGHVIGLGGMRKTCDECKGTRFVASDADVKKVSRPVRKSVKKRASSASRVKIVVPIVNDAVQLGE